VEEDLEPYVTDKRREKVLTKEVKKKYGTHRGDGMQVIAQVPQGSGVHFLYFGGIMVKMNCA